MIWNKDTVRFVVLRTIGNFFLLFSLWGMGLTFGPALYLEAQYRYNHVRNVQYALAQTGIPGGVRPTTVPGQSEPLPVPSVTPEPTAVPRSFFGQLVGGNHVEFLSPVNTDFGIVIPKIGANAPVIPNIDPGKPESYLPALQKGVAHSLGTVFPGVPGNIYLFAHSTDSFWNVGRYNAVFYLLKELDKGDEIDLFYQGKRHLYRVVNRDIVDPSDVTYLTEPTPYEQLTLQTCWPPGTTLQRLVVIARPEADLEESH